MCLASICPALFCPYEGVPKFKSPFSICSRFMICWENSPAGGCRLSWTFRISSGVSQGIDKSVVQSDWEFLRIGVDGRR